MKHRPRSSNAWSHFSLIENGKTAKCNHCNKTVVVANGSTGNLFRHMRLKHHNISMDKHDSETFIIPDQSNYTVVETRMDKSSEEIAHTALDVQCTNTPRIINTNSVSGESGQQPVSFYLIQSYDENKRQEIDKQLLKVIIKDLHPFHLVEDQEFIKFVNMLNPSYVLPNCKNLSNELLSQMYDSTVEELKSVLKNVTAVALTTDRWTSINNENFIAVTAHYLSKDLELKSSLLDCVSYQKLNSINIALFFQELTIDWDLANKILAVVTDGSEDILKAIKNCQWTHIPCFAHILNRVVESGLAEISPFVRKVRNVVQYFKRNFMALNNLHVMQNQMGLSNTKLKRDIPSRWDTTFDMLTRFLKNKVPLLSSIEQLQLHSFRLSSADFLYLENVIKILVIFNSIRIEICSEKAVPLSKVPHMIRFMSERLSNILEPTELHPEIIKMKNTLKEGLKQFEIFETNEIVLQSVLLDPRFKKRGFPDNFFEDTYSTLRQAVISVREEIINERNIDMSDTSKSDESEMQSEYFMDMWSEFDSKNPSPEQNITAVAKVEIDAFLNDSYFPMESNPLSYWANLSNQNKFPALFELAKQDICIPATSVSCHRMYSKAGNVFLKKRNYFTSSKVKKFLFLHHNL